MTAALLIASNAVAQVGHPPNASPYRDIRHGHTLAVMAGYFSGDGGQFNIGPHDAALYGVRFDIRTSRTMELGLGVAHNKLQRFIVDPFVTLANRKTGPVKQPVTFVDLTLQFNITGGKTWHRLAPYGALTTGLAIAGSTAADTSQYKFGKKIYLAPAAGFRLFLTNRLHLRAEARATFWKLNYPVTFQREPVQEPGTPENPNAVITGTSLTEWTTSSWLQAGLGYSISP